MLLPLIIAVLAFLAVGGVGFALAGHQEGDAKAAKRAKELGHSRRPRTAADTTEAAQVKRKQQNAEALKDLDERQKRSRARIFSVKGQIAQAAVNLPVNVFWMISVAIGLLITFLMFLIGAPMPTWALGFVAGTFGLPRWVLGSMIKGRQKKFVSQFADGVDIIVRGVKSGLPLNQCLRIIASESSEPLCGEFKSLCDAQAMGVPLDQNLQRLYERMPLPEVNFFATVLIIQAKTGGNLSEALGNLSGVLRSRKLLKEKVKALSSEARASAWIIGSLPVLVMVMVFFTRREYIMVLFTDPVGHVILAIAATMMALGIGIMKRMIDFKY
jgi:tight adherence protein B